MKRGLSILLGATAFAGIGLGSAYGYASCRTEGYRPDWELFFFIA